MDKLALTFDEAAEAVGVTKPVIRAAVRDNLLIATYISPRNPRIRLSDLEAWLDAKPTQTTG